MRTGIRTVTISDVAKRAEVSLKTVSRVINNEARVHEDTRARVLDAMQELGYTPNISAQRLARGRSRIMGVIFPRETGAFFNKLVYDILLADNNFGYEVLLHPASTGCDDESRQKILQLVTRHQADGLILVSPIDDDLRLLADLEHMGTPFVRLFPQDRSLPLPFVTARDDAGAYAVTEHLLQLGHRRIAFIGGPEQHQSSQERQAGFLAALAAYGVKPNAGWRCTGDFRFASGVATGQALLAQACRPTAIIAANDDMAAGALAAAHQMGIAVPGELSIAGFDDSMLARQVWPQLTTVHNPSCAIAQAAVDMLWRLMTGKAPALHQLTLETKLMIRQSTAPPGQPAGRLPEKPVAHYTAVA